MAASLETNKALAALLTAGIIASGSGVISRILYHPSMPEENAYVIAVPEAETGEGEEATAAEARRCPVLLAAASPEKGETVAKKCAACHSFEQGGAVKIGPPLWGVVGRDIASVEGFAYSDALLGKEGEWTFDELNAFIHDPKGTPRHQDGVRRHQAARGPGRSPGLSALARGGARAAAGSTAAEAGGGGTEAEPGAEREAQRPSQPVKPSPPRKQRQPRRALRPATSEASAAQAPDPVSWSPRSRKLRRAGCARTRQRLPRTRASASCSPRPTLTPARSPRANAGGGDEAACHSFQEGGPPRSAPAVGRDRPRHRLGGLRLFRRAWPRRRGAWDYQALDAFLAEPREWAPGTKMAFRGHPRAGGARRHHPLSALAVERAGAAAVNRSRPAERWP